MPNSSSDLVLVADDEEAIRIVIRRTLEVAGYRVLLAADGADAVRVYTERHAEIGLVVTDLSMPGMDGPCLIAALVDLNPSVRIVIMSGYHPTGIADSAFPRQVVGILDKPFTAEMLIASIRDGLTAVSCPGTGGPGQVGPVGPVGP